MSVFRPTSVFRPAIAWSVLGVALLMPFTSEARIKCWTNKDGITECGNVVPPEYAQEETRTIDRRGITTEVRPRAPTAEEVEAERLRKQEEERRQAEEAELIRQQQLRDRVLLQTYVNEEDIIRTRDRMTGTVNASIELSRINIQRLEERLAEERRRAASYERRGQAIPEQVLEEIQNLEGLIAERKAHIAQREQEREEMFQRYEADRVRFRELQGRQ